MKTDKKISEKVINDKKIWFFESNGRYICSFKEDMKRVFLVDNINDEDKLNETIKNLELDRFNYKKYAKNIKKRYIDIEYLAYS